MEYIFFVIGLIIGLVLFLYGLSFYDSSRKKRTRVTPQQRSTSEPLAVNPQSVLYEEDEQYPRKRICPLCGAVLTKYEALYAAQIEGPSGKKILIYGCRYCYREVPVSGEEPEE